MTHWHFGYLNEGTHFTWSAGSVATLVDFDHIVSDMAGEPRIYDGWCYPPLGSVHKTSSVAKPPPEIAQSFALPSTHQLTLTDDSLTDCAHFFIALLGFLKGRRLQQLGWQHFYKTPTERKLCDFLANDLEPPFHGQFARLAPWLAAHEERLFDALNTNLMAFGEWCAARHSLDYATLPDWWMLFDIYDRSQGRFWSTARRDAWASALGVAMVPRLHCAHMNLAQLRDWVSLSPSHFRSGHLEGVVIRRENAAWLQARAKLVRADFTQGINNHWRSRVLEWNQLADPEPHPASPKISPFYPNGKPP